MSDTITDTPKKIELDKIEVIYTKNNEKKFRADASSDDFKQKILYDPPTTQNKDGTWNISFKYKDKDKGNDIHEDGVISDEHKQNTDEVGKMKKNSVILNTNKKVIKLVTHTNIGDGYFSRKDAQRILIENSVFCFKAEIFVPYQKATQGCEKGDLHSATKTITFSLSAPLPKDEKTEEENNEKSNEQNDKKTDENSKVWKIKYSYVNNKKFVDEVDGVICDENSQTLIKQAINDACKKIFELKKHKLKVCELDNDADDDKDRISLVSFPGYKRKKDDLRNNSIVYSVEQFGSDYCIMTGLFCGIINFSNDLPPLEIRTEYTDTLVLRMIDRCCGIYVSSSPDLGSQGKMDDNFYSKIVQYMYLLSLRKVISILVPKRYSYIRDRGYEIRGNIDIERYINHDIIMKDKKLSYIYPERREIQPIIDVMYAALKSCHISGGSSLPNLKNYKDYLGSVYSGRRPSRNTIKNIGKEKILRNSLYSSFKRPLELAKMLLENEEMSTDNSETKNGISALLMDSSYLWETYLEYVMKDGLGDDWYISAQEDIYYYPELFYKQLNRPDFVLTNRKNDCIFVLDAKFKRMNFSSIDVDNSDLRQLHCYSYYYLLKHGDKFRGAALIYPTRNDPNRGEKDYSEMFGIAYAEDIQFNFDQIFGVLALKDANELDKAANNTEKSEDETVNETERTENEATNELRTESEILNLNEKAFISRLKAFLEMSFQTKGETSETDKS